MEQLFLLKVEQGQKEAVVELLDQNLNLVKLINEKTGQTLLNITARKNDLKMTQLLIQSRADINIQNKFGQTPLATASFYNRVEICQLLVQHEALLDLQDNKGWTPLMVVAHKGHLEIVELLLAAGADYSIMSKKNETLFDLCKNYQTLQFIIHKLGLEQVKVKYPTKFQRKPNTNIIRDQFYCAKQMGKESDNGKNILQNNHMGSTFIQTINEIFHHFQKRFNFEICSFKNYIISLGENGHLQEQLSEFNSTIFHHEKILNKCSLSEQLYDNYSKAVGRQLKISFQQIIKMVNDQSLEPYICLTKQLENLNAKESQPHFLIPEEVDSISNQRIRNKKKPIVGQNKNRTQLSKDIDEKLNRLSVSITDRIQKINSSYSN